MILFVLLIASIAALAQSRRRQRQQVPLKQISSGRIVVSYVPNSYLTENITRFAKRLEENLNDAESTLGTRLEKNLTVYLFGNWEEKGNYIDDVRLAHADSKSAALYCIMNPKWDGIAERMEFQILLRQAHGDPFRPSWEEYFSSALA